ncbi:hypothetical protein PHSC3_001456 [Chlamydiales bacterium STE3]|nr:hypothetical protein PHSC3_001456 [Chlamydiales bacterium STE3]
MRFYAILGSHKDAVYQNFKALDAKDIAEAITFIASRPPHVTIVDLIIYPQKQASPFMTHRET